MKRKVLALLLALVMALSLLPGAALAEGEEGDYIVEPTECGGCTWEITSEGELRIYPTPNGTGELRNWGTNNPPWYSYREKITSVTVQKGTIAKTCYQMFAGLTNADSIYLSGLDTSNVTSMINMFSGCRSLTSLNLSDFDTNNVKYMNCMFIECSGLTSLNLSGFNTSNVTNMHAMFYNCHSLTSLDLRDFDTSKVDSKYMTLMFNGFNSASYLLLPADAAKAAMATKAASDAGFTHVVYHDVTSLQNLPVDVYAKKVFDAEPAPAEHFLGWSTEKGGEVTYEKGEAITGVTTLDLYPVWGDHTWDAGTVTKEPTCTATGEMTYTCSAGGESRTETIPATGNHTWDEGRVTTQPTYSSTGVKTFTCTVCGEKKTETIPALVYVPVLPVTPTTPTVPAKPAEEDNWPFVDVGKGDDFYEAVKYVYDKGLMVGTSATTFDPYGPFTRAMVATVVFRMEDSPATPYRAVFTDVLAGQWHAEAITWGNDHAIVLGYGNGKFGPDDSVTVEQLLAILYRYAVAKDYDTAARGILEGYVDSENISAYAVEAAGWAVAKGLISGQGTLNPRLPATRAQVAEILMNFCLYVVK